jgi:hypothetical protein
MIIINSRLLELAGLVWGEHSKGGADFHAHTADLADHSENSLESTFATCQISPSGTHTESGASILFSFPGCLQDGFDIDQTGGFGRSRVS